MSILVINAGSSSVKFGLFDRAARNTLATALIDWKADPHKIELLVRPGKGGEQRSPLGSRDSHTAVAQAVRTLTVSGLGPAVTAVGHRVVHGGTSFRGSVRIDAAVKAELGRVSELAPLHNPPALAAIAAAEEALPKVPQVAVFDTAFFADLPPRAYVYPLPYEWFTTWGVRRFGFHGISHAYCSGRAGELLGNTNARLVICHLGNGCSATAVHSGTAVATTMGFTPLEGLMMGTRCGSVDPSILLHVLQKRGLSPDQLEDVLQHRSGLLGVSGISSDFRQVETAAQQGNERSQLALEIYAERVRAAIGSLAVTLGGVDALVFTAGVGEHSASLRSAACKGLECLGLHLDAERNGSNPVDADIATANSLGRILVIATREELLIARETIRLSC